MNAVEIYFDDLTEEAQQRVLEAAGTDRDDNWELSPLCVLEFESEEEDVVE